MGMARGLAAAALSLPSATPCSGRPIIRARARPLGARRRGLSMVVRAGGPPSTNALILAFVLPLSLFVGTLVTAARVGNDLDERFLREMAINQAILEEEDDAQGWEDEDEDEREYGDEREEEEDEEELQLPVPVEEKEAVGVAVGAPPPRTRNRPTRRV